MKRNLLFTLVIPVLGMLLLSGNEKLESPARAKPFAPISLDAADSLMARLDNDDRIAQLFVVRDTSSALPFVGGFLHNDIETAPSQAFLDPNGIPYFIGIDLLNSERPISIAEEQLAATNNPALVQSYAAALGATLKKNGYNFVVGPSLGLRDGRQSFADNPADVIEYGSAFVSGMQHANMLAVAGSFPHAGMPLDNADATNFGEAQRANMVPFKALINHGLTSIMFAQSMVPDSASTLGNPNLETTALLRDKMGFNGLAWADVSMVPTGNTPDVVELILSGTDVVIVRDLNASIRAVEAAIEEGSIDWSTINKKCKRILQSKLWSEQSLKHKEKSPAELELRHRQVIMESMVLLKNDNDVLPLQGLDAVQPAFVSISGASSSNLQPLVQRYQQAGTHHLRLDHLEADLTEFRKQNKQHNLLVIIASPEEDLPRKRFGIGEHYQSVLERLAHAQPTVLVWKGKAKALAYLEGTPNLAAIVLAHEPNELSDDFAMQLIYGGRGFKGQTKRRIGEFFPRHSGLNTEKTRLAYGIPEEVGINRVHLEKVDELVAEAIEKKATPGAQVWFAKDGIVVVNEAYGHHTYEGKDTVRHNDLYDLASITKVAGSVAGLMKLQQDGLFNLDHNLCDYLGPWVDTTDYMNMTIREILAHQAGLPPFIPFYQQTVKKGVPRYDIYSLAQSDTYPYRVATELYIHKDQPDKMFRQILNHKINDQKKYKYSDVGYYFMKRIIEQQSGLPMEQYLDRAYYQPMGMWTMCYRPLERFGKRQITPTEYDRFFRNQLVHGDVHDPGSAMMGGVGGHAGLFSNANDLGKMMQMMLNGGTYGGQTFVDSSIINQYTACQFCDNDNRRGAGFDKPLLDGSDGPSCGCTSLDAFGHQGFTGTVTWADPGEDVVYVFLSNRVYPNADNRKLASMNVRTNIQQAFYDAIEKSRSTWEGEQL